MGYKINVEHSQFNRTAEAIDKYISNMNKQMNLANNAMNSMFATWKGIDANAYKNKWDTVIGSTSTCVKMKKSLSSYSKYLRYAGNRYKTAQANAVNRANKLPRW